MRTELWTRLMNHLIDADLQAWIDEELDPGDRIRVADHLASCSDCRDALSELRAAAELFGQALVLYDEGVRRSSARASRVGRRRLVRSLPRWAGRAAAVTLLLGGAAAAAVIPGSPLRELFLGSDVVETNPAPSRIATIDTGAAPGASITVPPLAGRLRIRITGFPVGARIRIVLTDRAVVVASLPDGEPYARFVVAEGSLEVVGPGSDGAPQAGNSLVLQLPRQIKSGVVELNGVVVARVSSGRIDAERQVSRLGDEEVIIEVGG